MLFSDCQSFYCSYETRHDCEADRSVFASGGKPAEIRNLINDVAAIFTLDFFLVRRTGEKFMEPSDTNRKQNLKKKKEKVESLVQNAVDRN